MEKGTDYAGARSCLVGGHNFCQRGDELIDTEVEKFPNAKRIEVRFDTREYFELIAKHPKTLPAFKGARHVKVVLGGVIYDVHE